MPYTRIPGIYAQVLDDEATAETTGAFTITVNGGSGTDPAYNFTAVSQTEIDEWGTFATLAAAVAVIPKQVEHTITINIASGTYSTVSLSNFKGSGRINFIGGYTAVTPATGPGSGTAAAGTTTTAIKNPGANWTANDLQEKFMVLSSGGGSPSVKPILSNTTTDAITHAVTGQAQGSVFTIGTANVTGVTAIVTDCRCLIYFYGMQFTRASSSDSRVYYDGCYFSTVNSDGTLRSDYDRTLQVYNCLFDDVASIYALGTNIIEVLYCAFSDGALTVIDADRVTTEIDARLCTQEPVYLKDVRSADVGLAANNNALGATGGLLHLNNVARCTAYGTGITGTTSNTSAYGVKIENGGLFIATGVTIAGATGDILHEGNAFSWANLASYGILSWGRSTIALASYTWDYINNNVQVNGVLAALSDVQISGSISPLYGYFKASYSYITAYAGGGQANATEVSPFTTYIEVCATAGDSVKLRSNPTIPGMHLWVRNAGANSCNVYPASGHTIDALGANNPYALAAGGIALFVSRSSSTWDAWRLA